MLMRMMMMRMMMMRRRRRRRRIGRRRRRRRRKWWTRWSDDDQGEKKGYLGVFVLFSLVFPLLWYLCWCLVCDLMAFVLMIVPARLCAVADAFCLLCSPVADIAPVMIIWWSCWCWLLCWCSAVFVLMLLVAGRWEDVDWGRGPRVKVWLPEFWSFWSNRWGVFIMIVKVAQLIVGHMSSGVPRVYPAL